MNFVKNFRLFLVFLHLLTFSWGIQAQESEKTFSDGSPVYVEQYGFTINPPAGWEIVKNTGAILEFRRPKEPNSRYQGNLKIVKQSEKILIHDISINKIKEEMTKFYQNKSYLSDYNLRNHDFFELGSGSKSVIIYSDFSMKELEMMQASIFIPTVYGHLIATYTDLRSNFEGDQSTVFSDVVFPSIASITLDEEPGFPYRNHILTGLVLLLLLLCFGAALFYQWYKAKKMYSDEIQIASDEDAKTIDLDDMDSSAQSVIEEISEETAALDVETQAYSRNNPEAFDDDEDDDEEEFHSAI